MAHGESKSQHCNSNLTRRVACLKHRGPLTWNITLAFVSEMKHTQDMKNDIGAWLEEKTGDSRRAMALKLGQAPSTFNRNIETAEVITATCRAYGINPVLGLVAAGILAPGEIAEAAGEQALDAVSERALLEEVLRRVTDRESELLAAPVILDADGIPDLSAMTNGNKGDWDLASYRNDGTHEQFEG